ncbi:hypothetical protein BV25DRAFT_1253857 [Artomyces pyxidatus]|uniref:Uncharacterized protein n=1 Tax=Artomyces pyxidatus TaxID=48021 RepID=A0ACB8TEJ9_9AGAM|nr:hypothetical protein BV25DRAFT_1253857 [Artomyces pyxidatus]
MAIPPSQYPVVLDATMGPYGGHHVPARSLLAYLVSAVDTPADTDLYEVTGERVGLESEAWKVTGITLTSPEEYANLAPGNKAHALGPAAPPANKTDEHLRAAISRAEVPNADPPRYQQIDVDGIAKLVASTAQLELQVPISFVPGLSMSSLSFDLADPKRPSPIFPALRVSLTLASFFSGALTAMRAAIVPTDARMQDSFIKAAAPAGQYALQYTDGNTYMFVRGDCYVELHGDREVTMETLGAVAQALDKNFKTREVADRAAISCPAVDDVMAPKTPVCLGMEFGVTLRVQNAKDATVHAVCDIIVVQLLEVRTVDASAGQMEVRLRANGVGRTRVELFVADRATMGVSTAFVDLEVDG